MKISHKLWLNIFLLGALGIGFLFLQYWNQKISKEIFDLIEKELKVSFIYKKLKDESMENKELSIDEIAQIPKSIQKNILQAIKEGDRGELRDITNKLKQKYPTIAKKLEILIDGYLIETIEKLFSKGKIDE